MIRLQKMYYVSMKYARIFHILFGRRSSISYSFAILLLELIFIALSLKLSEDAYFGSINCYFYGILDFIFIKTDYKKAWIPNHFNAYGSVG